MFFFSSGAVEEHWTRKDLGLNRANVYIGFPLGGVLSLSIMALAALVFAPLHIGVDTLPQVALPVAVASGKIALACVIFGIFAATFGAALETTLSSGYCVSQYFGWQWGKYLQPRNAARFHVVTLVMILLGVFVILTGIDPVKVTEYSFVLSAAALPLTYFPILLVSNDPTDDHHQGRRMSEGRRIWAALQLLDRQLVAHDGLAAGCVDDIELTASDDGDQLYVTAILSGPGALFYRLNARRLGRWLRRIHGEVAVGDNEDPTRIPFNVVTDIGPDVKIGMDVDEVGSASTERWVRDHIVMHIPGSGNAPQ